MADRFEELMKSIAEEADAKVEYAAMREAVLQKAAVARRRQVRFVRYGAMAATLVILAGVGTLFLKQKGGMNATARDTEQASPQAMEYSFADSADGIAPAGDPEMPEAGNASMAVPEEAEKDAVTSGALPESAPISESPEESDESFEATSGANGVHEIAPNATGTPDAVAVAFSPEELCALCLTARADGADGALASFEFLYAPVETAEGYRLVDIVADCSGVTYTYNRAAAEASDDAYALILPAVSLSGARAETDADGIYAPADALVSASAEGSLTWVLGGGEAKLEPYAGCTLSEAELRALCSLRLMEIE